MTTAPAEAPILLVVGLGNSLRGDDAVGLRTAEAVGRLLDAEPVPGARVITSTRAGFELMDLVAGASRAILVDCLELPDAEPGRVHLLSIDDVAGSTRLIGAHDVSVGEALSVARAAGIPMPDEVDIYAVEVAGTDRIEEGLSREVARAVPALARRIHGRLADLAAGRQPARKSGNVGSSTASRPPRM